MGETRRGFLAAMAGAFVVDPERALWVPGKRTISIPKDLNVEAELERSYREAVLTFQRFLAETYQVPPHLLFGRERASEIVGTGFFKQKC